MSMEGTVKPSLEEMDFESVENVSRSIAREVGKVLVGKKDLIHKTLVALFSNGHVLLEGVPGLAKTYFAKAFASSIGCTFKRIQFLPDLLPSDIVGINVFNPKHAVFNFKPGPVFANIVLADEINRASPKTQSALLEAMEERQVTVEGKLYPLSRPFVVFGTQNPIEIEGTYPLPEAQIDRFFFKIHLGYPSHKEEEEILRRKHSGVAVSDVKTVVSPEEVVKVQDFIQENVHVDNSIIDYITRIVETTRLDNRVRLGCSPRASITLLYASKTNAVLAGRDFVIPEDVQSVAFEALNHRIIMNPESDIEGVSVRNVIESIMEGCWVPR